MKHLESLAAKWQQEASEQRDQWRNETAASVLDRARGELLSALHKEGGELLNLSQAARESGYTADHIGRLVKEGKLCNHGRPHAPRVRRGDLPRKPQVLRDSSAIHRVASTRMETALAVINS
jgi:hypothetical protein